MHNGDGIIDAAKSTPSLRAQRRGNDWIKSVICAAHHLVCHEQ